MSKALGISPIERQTGLLVANYCQGVLQINWFNHCMLYGELIHKLCVQNNWYLESS